MRHRLTSRSLDWINANRHYITSHSANAVARRAASTNAGDVREPLPFSSIPGPRNWPILKSLLEFVPGGSYYNVDQWSLLQTLAKTHGPIFKLEMPLRRKIVFITRDEDFARVYQADGKFPLRDEFRAHVHYRRSRGLGEGMAAAEGERWRSYRSVGQSVLGGPGDALKYLDVINSAAQVFVNKLAGLCSKHGAIDDFVGQAKKWSFESMNMILLGEKIGLFDNDQTANTLFEATLEFFELCTKLETSYEIWRIYPTEDYKRLVAAENTMWNICCQYVTRNLECPREGSMLAAAAEKIVGEEKRQRMIEVMVDLLISSIDTTATTLTYFLHCLAVNHTEQQLCRREIHSVMGPCHQNTCVHKEHLANMTYLKASFKEALRVHPVTAGVGRVVTKDIVLSGYLVPAQTKVVLLSSLSSNDDANFPNPQKFVPERWIRDNSLHSKASHWCFLPFGHGPRSCIGRRFAEVEVWTAIVHILHKFSVQTNTPHFDKTMKLINMPDRPINITLLN